ncbi:PD-(D/E)XK nuclease family protein [Candidatus Methylacidiphilum infernorum]|uniref:PD-(D/E)XK nuclease family protein n=1 Tax=Candidatus Methylacidiphilum infernorum TaxID=511746 RepID=A0ABX7PUS4_9BACT|nr:DNA translocase FtsK [Candidatus Methylacidiphilum infernorum]QSR86403.1 PD-(D/E)XK nuclease family protein [Candidatus Methylacidiphilum infernorum]
MEEERWVEELFGKDKVDDPRRDSDQPILGLNQKALNFLLSKIEGCSQGRCPNKALFLSSPAAGYGKTFLIGQLIRKNRGKANIIYIQPFEETNRSWEFLFNRMILELQQEEWIGNERSSLEMAKGITQIDVFIHRVLGNLLADVIKQGLVDPSELITEGLLHGLTHPREVEGTLRKGISIHFDFADPKEKWQSWMKRNFKSGIASCCEHALYERRIFLSDPLIHLALLWVFFLYEAYRKERSSEEWSLCWNWLKYGFLDDKEEYEKIGIGSLFHREVQEINQEVMKNRIFDFCKLAVFARPFVFCFDQTEIYGSSPELANRFGLIVSTLVDQCPNQLTLVTANLPVWEKSILPHLEEAYRDRFLYPPVQELQLDPINKNQAMILVEQRMDKKGVEEPIRTKVREAVCRIFEKRKSMGVREFLQELKKHHPSIEELFNKYKSKLATDPKNLEFYPENLSRVVEKFFEQIPSGRIDREPKSKYFSFSWSSDSLQMQFYFGFVESSFHKVWEAIAKKTTELKASYKGRFLTSLFFRTPKLDHIPKEKWKKVKEAVEEAQNSSALLIVSLDQDWTLSFYALNQLLLESASEDIPYPQAKIQSFLKDKLSPFFESLHPMIKIAVTGGQAPPPKEMSVTELVDQLLGQKRGEKRSNMDLGELFHQLVKDFSEKLKENPQAEARGLLNRIIQGHKEKIRFLSPGQKDFLRKALDSFLVESLLKKKRSGWTLEELFWQLEQGFEAFYPGDQASQMIKIKGSVDRLSKDRLGRIELVDYKILQGEAGPLTERYLLQLALYSWLLDRNSLKPDLARLEYFSPGYRSDLFSKEKLDEIFDSKIKPFLDRLLQDQIDSVPPEPEKKKVPPEFEEKKEKLKLFFEKNKIKATVEKIKVAPQFGRFLLSLDPTTRSGEIIRRKGDIAIYLGYKKEEITITEGREYLELDCPRDMVELVSWTDARRYMASQPGELCFPIGKTIDTEEEWLTGDFSKSQYPHLLVGGATGSGKSQFLKVLIAHFLLKRPKVELFVADFKGQDFVFKETNPSPLRIVHDREKTLSFLNQMVQEMESRFKTGKDSPKWIVIFDEYADMLGGANPGLRKELERLIQRLAQKGRAAGIHLVIATQYPKKEVVSTLIKTNLPGRICLKVPDGKASEVILDKRGAESLRGAGDLYCNLDVRGSLRLIRAQAPFISEQEWEEVGKEAAGGL